MPAIALLVSIGRYSPRILHVMKKIPGILLIFFLSLQNISLQETSEAPLLVTVYYESEDFGCKYFIERNLYTAWANFYKNVSFELIPFGIAQQSFIDGHWTFHCQNGPEECQKNKVHACVIREACGKPTMQGCEPNNVGKILDYINCLISLISDISECAKRVGLSGTAVSQCAGGSEGTKLLNYYGNVTSAFPYKLLRVPTIAFNGVPMNGVASELIEKICEARPALCKPRVEVIQV